MSQRRPRLVSNAQRPARAVRCLALLAACLALAGALSPLARAQSPAGAAFDPPRGDQRMVVLGDFNGPYGATSYPAPVARVIGAVTQVWRPDLLLSPGDVIAGQSRELDAAQLRAMWQAFDREVAGRLRAAGVPYAVALGNHDASSLTADGAALFALDRAAAAEYWGQPQYAGNLAYVDRRGFPFDFAFVAGESFVAVLDASSAHVSDHQLAWLVEVLATPAARAARLRVVVGHLPLLPVGQGRDRPGEVIARGPELASLLEAAGVDLYVSGHHAAYYPARWGELELLFAGGIGARQLLGDDRPPRSTVTVIDIWHEPLVLRYTTFDAATFELVTAASLPAQLAGGLSLSARAGDVATATADPGAP